VRRVRQDRIAWRPGPNAAAYRYFLVDLREQLFGLGFGLLWGRVLDVEQVHQSPCSSDAGKGQKYTDDDCGETRFHRRLEASVSGWRGTPLQKKNPAVWPGQVPLGAALKEGCSAGVSSCPGSM